jgi:hypothetical protein
VLATLPATKMSRHIGIVSFGTSGDTETVYSALASIVRCQIQSSQQLLRSSGIPANHRFVVVVKGAPYGRPPAGQSIHAEVSDFARNGRLNFVPNS